MKNKWEEIKPVNDNDRKECFECGKVFYGYWKNTSYVSATKQLAGHILSSKDHYDKRWARHYIYDNTHRNGLEEW